jgi:hypothetical protein
MHLESLIVQCNEGLFFRQRETGHGSMTKVVRTSVFGGLTAAKEPKNFFD